MMIRTIAEKKRTSHGRAKCNTCNTAIEKGASYTRTTYVGDESIYSINCCEPCEEFYGLISSDPYIYNYEDGISEEQAIAWAQEYGIFSNDERERTSAVGFLTRLGLSIEGER